MAEVIQYNTRDMLAALQIATAPTMFLQNRLVKRTSEHGTKHIEIDTVRGGHRVARYVDRAGDAKVIAKPGFGTKLHVIPYTKEKTVLTPEDLETRTPGTTIYQSGSPASRRDALVGRWLRELDNRIVRLEEKQLADALVTGKVTVAGDGVSYEVDYGRNAGNSVTLTAGDRWSEASTRDIPKNMRDAANQMVSPGVDGGYPTIAIFGRAAAGYFISDSEIRARLDNRRMEMGGIDPRVLADQKATFLGTFRDSGINVDCYTYDAQYVDTAAASQFYIPTNNVIFINEGLRCERHYGMISNLKSGNFIGRRFPLNWISDDGSKWILQLESSPLVCLHEPDATYNLQTV